eukprot:GFUD01005501.1.p1 GENE.GFUD01005501.1~~GFUD01005501.1.p1  ORF type:complete len:315 (-),score=68.13 GFUD01005501.1:101-1045(-)
MDYLDDEELAFCGECGQEEMLENEEEILKTVFDEENNISNENDGTGGTIHTNKCMSTYYVNSIKNSSQSRIAKRKRLTKEAWIVNPNLVSRRKQTLAETSVIIKFHEIKSNSQWKVEEWKVADSLKDCGSVPQTKVEELKDQCVQRETYTTKLQNHGTSNDEIIIKNPDSQNYLCDMCGKVYLNENCFKNHIVDDACSEKLMLDCNRCIVKFALESSVRISSKLEGNKPDPVLKCTFCGLDFNQTNKLQTHLRTKHLAQLRKVLKDCFHVETKNDLTEESLIVRVLPQDMKIKAEEVNEDASDEKVKATLNLPA